MFNATVTSAPGATVTSAVAAEAPEKGLPFRSSTEAVTVRFVGLLVKLRSVAETLTVALR